MTRHCELALRSVSEGGQRSNLAQLTGIRRVLVIAQLTRFLGYPLLTKSKRGLFVFLLAAIIFASYPLSSSSSTSLRSLQDFTWRVLYGLGVDVSITPITSDMALVFDSQTGDRAYLEPYTLKVELANGSSLSRTLFADEDLYLVRLPILLMMDYKRSGDELTGFVRVVCRNLSYVYESPVTAWSFLINQRIKEEHPCYSKT